MRDTAYLGQHQEYVGEADAPKKATAARLFEAETRLNFLLINFFRSASCPFSSQIVFTDIWSITIGQ